MHVALALRETTVFLRRHGQFLLEGERHELVRVAELPRPQRALLAEEKRADVAEAHVVFLLVVEDDGREVHPFALGVVVLYVLVDRHVVLDAVHPVERHGVHARTRRKFIRDRLARRPGLRADIAHVLHRHRGRRRVHQVERPERRVQHVVTHVAERAVAEAADVVPALAKIGPTIGTHLGRPHPQIPVHALRWLDHWAQAPLRVEAVAPAPHFTDLSQRAALHVLRDERLERPRMPMVARLRHDAVFPLRLREQIRLLLGVADRLLDVDVDALLHAGDRDGRVRLLVRGDDRRIDLVPHLVQKLAVVCEFLHFRKIVGWGELRDAVPGETHLRRVGVDHRDDLLVQALRHEHALHAPATSNQRHADLPPRRNLLRPALPEGDTADVECRCASGQSQKFPSLHLSSPRIFISNLAGGVRHLPPFPDTAPMSCFRFYHGISHVHDTRPWNKSALLRCAVRREHGRMRPWRRLSFSRRGSP